MIVIERTHQEPNPRGGGKLTEVDKKCFSDDDKEGIEEFMNEKSEIPGYEWTNVQYNYIIVKL